MQRAEPVRELYTDTQEYVRPEGCTHVATYQWLYDNAGHPVERIDVHGSVSQVTPYANRGRQFLEMWHDQACEDETIYSKVEELLTC